MDKKGYLFGLVTTGFLGFACLNVTAVTKEWKEMSTLESKVSHEKSSVQDSLLNIEKDPKYVASLQKPFHAKKLADARRDMMLSGLQKGDKINEHLIVMIEKDEFFGVLDAEGHISLKGYISYNVKTRACTINFGPEYGATRMVLSSEVASGVKKWMDKAHVPSSGKMIFDYKVVSTSGHEEGNVRLTEAAWTSLFKYDANNERLKSARQAFSLLFYGIVAQAIQKS